MRQHAIQFMTHAIGLAALVAAVLAFLLLMFAGGCSHLPVQLTRAAATGCGAMLDQAAVKCGDPITAECAAEVWNVPEDDARALLEAAGRVAPE